jgi:hypothetical protein
VRRVLDSSQPGLESHQVAYILTICQQNIDIIGSGEPEEEIVSTGQPTFLATRRAHHLGGSEIVTPIDRVTGFNPLPTGGAGVVTFSARLGVPAGQVT